MKQKIRNTYSSTHRMAKTTIALAILGFVTLSTTKQTHAIVTSLSPFTGSVQENFESFPNYITSGSSISNPTSIMGGSASVTGIQNYIYGSLAGGVGAYWALGTNNIAQSFDGVQGLGMNNAASNDAAITFATSATQFGAYFGNVNGTGTDGMTINFFDTANTLFYTQSWNDITGNGSLTWHGWDSTTPIKRIEIQGNSPVADSMRATVTIAAPEPGTMALLAVGGTGFVAKLRRRKTILQ
jgi:hypothetical protein